VFYIVRRQGGRDQALAAVRALLNSFHAVPLDAALVEAALASEMPDFEDGLQAHAAAMVGAAFIITRNEKDFERSPVPSVNPARFIELLAS
jgi:hypothetical protein